MKSVHYVLFAMLSLSLIHCGASMQARLVIDNVSEEYKIKAYGENPIKNAFADKSRDYLYIVPEYNFNDTIRLYKESVMSDKSISHEEKEKLFSAVDNKLKFVKNGYLTYSMRIWEPKLINVKDFRIIMNDADGNPLIKNVLDLNFKRTLTITDKYSTYTDITYHYVWFMKFNKPFTKENFPLNAYTCRVIHPNGQDAVYEISPQ